MRLLRLGVLVLVGFVVAAEASAQGRRDRPEPVPDGPARPDFLFSPPKVSVGFRGNWLFARAGSDWYSFVTDQLTINHKDFNAPGFAADVGISITPKAEAVIGVEFSNASTASEYRRFVDNNRLPIQQNTRLRTVNLTGSVKYSLMDRGFQVSRLAWVPRGWIPYVGAGGGVLRYDLEQFGDFIDFVDNSVFGSSFRSSGWAPLAQAFGGVDVRVMRRVYVTLDARYQWAAAGLGSTWIDFDPIDLAGFKLAAGASLVF